MANGSHGLCGLNHKLKLYKLAPPALACAEIKDHRTRVGNGPAPAPSDERRFKLYELAYIGKTAI